jgi:hypothetical protein
MWRVQPSVLQIEGCRPTVAMVGPVAAFLSLHDALRQSSLNLSPTAVRDKVASKRLSSAPSLLNTAQHHHHHHHLPYLKALTTTTTPGQRHSHPPPPRRLPSSGFLSFRRALPSVLGPISISASPGPSSPDACLALAPFAWSRGLSLCPSSVFFAPSSRQRRPLRQTTP